MTEHEWLTSTDQHAMLRVVGYAIAHPRILVPVLGPHVVRQMTARQSRFLADADVIIDPRVPMSLLLREIVGNPFRPVALLSCLPSSEDMTVRIRFVPTGRTKGRYEVLPDWLTDQVIHMARVIDEAKSFEDMPILADALEDAGCPDTVECELRYYGENVHRGKVSPTINEDGERVPDADWICVPCHGTGRVLHTLLAHLRSPGPHVRGCWALDLILGRE